MTKYMVRHILTFLLALATGMCAMSQPSTATTQGRDFWLAFMMNHNGYPGTRSIIVTAEEGATVQLTNASGTLNRTLTLAPMSSDSIGVPNENGESYHVTSDRDISVYASNFMDQTFDIATVYPTTTLRSRYMVQCYEDQNYSSDPPHTHVEFTVLAVEDNTVVNITPPGGETMPFTMMAGETAEFVKEEYAGAHDFDGLYTGTMVEAMGGKKVAVFQGNTCTDVGESACDHLYEQAVPMDYWGQEFAVVPLAGRLSYDRVKITSSANMCRVAVNDTFAVMLNAGESYIVARCDAYRISTSRPATVCMYFADDAGAISSSSYVGDPSAVILPPLDQGAQQSTFFAVSTALSTHLLFANVVVNKCYVPGMTLDGHPVDTTFRTLDSTYSYAQLHVTPGTHTLACEYGTFQAVYYGLGPWESYAYIAAMGMQQRDVHLLVNGVEVTDKADICYGDTAQVELRTGTSFRDTRWRLDGDTLPSSELALRLHFADTGTHTLQAMLHGDCCQRWCDSLQVILRVRPSYRLDETDRFCENTPYPWRDTVLFNAGSYADSLTTAAGCDSVFSLHLEAMKVPLPGIDLEADCRSHAYRLAAQHLDTMLWTAMRWSAVPDDPALHGHESDTVIYTSPSVATFYSLRAELECPADTTVLLRPIVWPVAVLRVVPEKITLGHQSAFDAHDMSLHATGREWTVDGQPLGEVGPHLHYNITGTEDSIEVMLTAVNDYCRDTTQAVVIVNNDDIYAPNIFTPQQSTNNRFAIVAAEEIDGELTIYNREGTQVYVTIDLQSGWNGGSCPQGAYVWRLRYRYSHNPDRWHDAIGTVTLLR